MLQVGAFGAFFSLLVACSMETRGEHA